MKKLKIIGIFVISIIVILLGIDLLVVGTTRDQIKGRDLELEDVDCILVLGAGIRGDEPSPMLQDRLDVAIELYNNSGIKKILVSGDHQADDYNEVAVMKNYLVNKGILAEDVFIDHYGVSTYDSIYRLRPIFEVKKVVIVSQEYHLYRSLYIANSLGYEAYGVAADNHQYVGQQLRDIREFLARIKDMIKSIIKPSSEYLGQTYHIGGNGDKTNERKAG